MRYIFFILLFGICETSYSQVQADSIYNNFKLCIENFFIRTRKNESDTMLIIFNRNPVGIEKNYQDGGITYSIIQHPISDSSSLELIDKSRLKDKLLINEKESFNIFLDFVVGSKDIENPGISKASGSVSYVYMPFENWQQFYLDYLLGYDSLYITTTVDFFDFQKNYANHTRYQIKCSYTSKSKFKILDTTLIRRKKFSYNK